MSDKEVTMTFIEKCIEERIMAVGREQFDYTRDTAEGGGTLVNSIVAIMMEDVLPDFHLTIRETAAIEKAMKIYVECYLDQAKLEREVEEEDNDRHEAFVEQQRIQGYK